MLFRSVTRLECVKEKRNMPPTVPTLQGMEFGDWFLVFFFPGKKNTRGNTPVPGGASLLPRVTHRYRQPRGQRVPRRRRILEYSLASSTGAHRPRPPGRWAGPRRRLTASRGSPGRGAGRPHTGAAEEPAGERGGNGHNGLNGLNGRERRRLPAPGSAVAPPRPAPEAVVVR